MNATTIPPATLLQQLAGGVTATNLLYVAAELGIADLLGDGPRTGAELASLTGAHAGSLHRVLRGLAALGLLTQSEDTRFALTPVGACLRTDAAGSLRPQVRLACHPVVQRAWGDLLHTVITGETAFDHVTGMDFMQYMEQQPDFATRFNAMMGDVTAQTAAAVVAAYDFAGIETVVDVGGGAGVLLRAILSAHPHSRGVILDLPHARVQAEAAIAVDGLSDRCRFEAGDFFAELPAGADAYLLKSVIHDWDDESCVRILEACRRAMPPAGRLLLVEGLLPEAGPAPLNAVISDLIMLTMARGRERTEAELRTLLTRAGLRLLRVIPTPSGPSLLEAMDATSIP